MTFCVISFQAKGQSSVGVKADVNVSNFVITQSTNVKCSRKTGCSAGFFYKYKWHESKALQTDVMFRYRTSKINNNDTDEIANYRYYGVELPLYFLQQVEIDNSIFYAGIGPFASFGLTGNYNSNHRQIDLYQKDKTIMHRLDLGIGILIGYETKSRLQFNFNYQMGFRNIICNEIENVNMTSQMLSLGLGYRFLR